MSELFDWKTTALVLIDLQNWVRNNKYAPYTQDQVIANAAKLVEAFHQHESFVAPVRVWTKDGKDMLHPTLDQEAPRPNLVESWMDIVPELGVTATDHVITKLQWGAFHGTDLDLQLRRRGIKTIVLGGIAAGIGVDTTAREAFQHGYDLIFVMDAITGISPKEFDYVQEVIFPRMGRIRNTEDVLNNA